MFFGGIDVAKHRHELCLTDDAGNVIRQMFIDNSQKGFMKLLQALDHLGMEPGGVEFCMEATGHYWLALYCHLVELDHSVHVINPIQSDAMRNLPPVSRRMRKKKVSRFHLTKHYLRATLMSVQSSFMGLK